MGTQFSMKQSLFQYFWLCFSLLLWKETPLLEVVKAVSYKVIFELLAGHAYYLNASVTMQMFQTKASCNTFLK